MNISTAYDKTTKKYEWKGRQEFLTSDGAVDHQIWDELVLATTRDDRQEFIKTVFDPRLREMHIAQRGGEAADLSGLLGKNWKAEQKHYLLGNAEGSHQRLEFGTMGRSGGAFKVITVASNADVGRMEHTIEANFSFGNIQDENIRESLSLEG